MPNGLWLAATTRRRSFEESLTFGQTKAQPESYARRTVMKAQADLQRRAGIEADEVDPVEITGPIPEK